MRNLIAFFKRFQVFLVFVSLQVLAFSVYFTFMSFPKSQYLTSASIVSGKILSMRHEVTKLFSLSHENGKLQRANIKLRKQLPISFIQIDRKKFKIEDTLFHVQYEYIPGEVINSTFDKRNNYFTLNIGKLQGVKRDMGVFSDKGIVGVVHNVSDHFCVVKSVLTQDINIDVMIEKSGAHGLLKWDASHARYGSISGISNDMRVKKWQKVVTKGGTGMFPRGLPVGKIAKISSVEGKPLWDITILFAEDFRRVQRVYVIKNLLKTEQEHLESLIPEDQEQ